MWLSRRTQAWIVASLLDGVEVAFDPEDLAGPWREYFEWIASGPEDEAAELRWSAFVNEFMVLNDDHQDRFALIKAAREGPDPFPPVDVRLEELPELRWLWPCWVPRGLLSLLVAEPGTGKSYLALDLARRVIQGSVFPDGQPVGQTGRSLYVDAENTPQVLRERLGGWSRSERRGLFLLLPDAGRLMLDLNEFEDRERLLDAVFRIRPALVIVDSYGASTVKGENNKEDVQGILAFLSKVALDYDCAMVVVHHLRKKSSAQLSLPSLPLTIDTIRGSSHIAAMARVVLGMQWVGGGQRVDRNGPRRLEVIKSNLTRYPPALGVFFEPLAGNPEVAELSYGEPPEVGRGATKLELCADWLVALLEKCGALAPGEVVAQGLEAGFSESTVYRARKALRGQVVDTRGWRDPGNQWVIEEEEGAEQES